MPAVQFALLVLDSSGSMSEAAGGQPAGITKVWQIEEMLLLPLANDLNDPNVDKAAELEKCGLIARMQNSYRAKGTDLAILRFDSTPAVYYDANPILDYSLSSFGTRLSPPLSDKDQRYTLDGKPFDLLRGKGDTTNIAAALRMALDAASQWLTQAPKGYDAFVTILLMSDMLPVASTPREALDAAAQIKATHMIRNRPQIVLAAAAYGDNADLDLMKQLASPGVTKPDQFYIKTNNPIELRKFFLESATAHADMIQP